MAKFSAGYKPKKAEFTVVLTDTKFPGAKACHISLGSSWKWLNLAGYKLKQDKFMIVLTEFLLCSSVIVGLCELDVV